MYQWTVKDTRREVGELGGCTFRDPEELGYSGRIPNIQFRRGAHNRDFDCHQYFTVRPLIVAVRDRESDTEKG